MMKIKITEDSSSEMLRIEYCTIHLCYGNAEELDAELLKHYPCTRARINDAIGQVIASEKYGGQILVMFNSAYTITPGDVAHEAMHCLEKIYKYINTSIDGGEKDAYLLQYIVTNIYTFINDQQIEK